MALDFKQPETLVDVAAIVEENPSSVLLDDNLYDRFLAQLGEKVKSFVPDLSTATSRKKITSEAFKITRFKTSIDDAGKKLNEDARKQINAVDAKRRTVKADLEKLAEELRRPLTNWENQEEARVDYCKAILKSIEDCGNGLIGGEPYPFPILFRELEEKIVINAELGEFEEQARTAHRIATDKLKAAYDAHMRAEADRVELEKLRAEKEERDRAEREKQEAVAKAEAEARAVREEAERAEQQRQAVIRREQAEREAREKDRDHRAKIMGEAKQALIAQGAGEATAKKIVLAIIAGEIPHTRLEF